MGIGIYIFISNGDDNPANGIDDNDGDNGLDGDQLQSGLIIDHTNSHLEDFVNIPLQRINEAKEKLKIVYWHTSHGSQLTSGMRPLDDFMGGNSTYEFDSDGSDGALHLYEPSSDHLTGNTQGFDDTTQNFLSTHPDYNVIMWSWCGLDKSESSINNYLNNMDKLEENYPNKVFIYMTAHLEGTGEEGDLHYYNEMIRQFCIDNNKVLYDFADIESYNPDDKYFLDKYADDECYYDGDNDGELEDWDGGDDREYNWAKEWQESHNGVDCYSEGGKWYSCSCAHSQPLNGNMKAYGTWYLFARLAGWSES